MEIRCAVCAAQKPWFVRRRTWSALGDQWWCPEHGAARDRCAVCAGRKPWLARRRGWSTLLDEWCCPIHRSERDILHRKLEEQSQERRREGHARLLEQEPGIVPLVRRAEGLSDAAVVSVLRRLCAAYIANDRRAVAELEPTARAIGHALNLRGGLDEMRRVFTRLGKIPGSRTLEMHWNGIGDWRG